MARACSVLQFHAINTLVAICRGGDGGASSIGRPLSNRQDSIALLCRAARILIGPFHHYYVENASVAANKLSPSDASSNQPKDIDSVVSVERGTSCCRMKVSKICRAFFVSSAISCLYCFRNGAAHHVADNKFVDCPP